MRLLEKNPYQKFAVFINLKKITIILLALFIFGACSSNNMMAYFSDVDRSDILINPAKDDLPHMDNLGLTKIEVLDSSEFAKEFPDYADKYTEYTEYTEFCETTERYKLSIVESIETIAKYDVEVIDESEITGEDYIVLRSKEGVDYLRLYRDGKGILKNEEGRYAIKLTGDDFSTEYENILDNIYLIYETSMSLVNREQ